MNCQPLDNNEGSQIVVKELEELYKLTYQRGIGCLMDEGTFNRRLEHLQSSIKELTITQTETAIDQTVYSASHPYDSCGTVASQLCDLLLVKGHTMNNVKHGFGEPNTFLQQLHKMKKISFPMLMRVEIKRETHNNSWISSHSYIAIVHDIKNINVIQAYVGHYTPHEYLHSKQWQDVKEYNNKHTLVDYLQRLLALQSANNKYDIYYNLFGSDFARRAKCNIKVECRFHPLDIKQALNNIEQKRIFIKSEVSSVPKLLISNYYSVMCEKLYQASKATFSCYKHHFTSDPSHLHFKQFCIELDATRIHKAKSKEKHTPVSDPHLDKTHTNNDDKQLSSEGWFSFWHIPTAVVLGFVGVAALYSMKNR